MKSKRDLMRSGYDEQSGINTAFPSTPQRRVFQEYRSLQMERVWKHLHLVEMTVSELQTQDFTSEDSERARKRPTCDLMLLMKVSEVTALHSRELKHSISHL